MVKYVRFWLAYGWNGQWLHLYLEYAGSVFFVLLLLFCGVRVHYYLLLIYVFLTFRYVMCVQRGIFFVHLVSR